jgi:hypothetical protein
LHETHIQSPVCKSSLVTYDTYYGVSGIETVVRLCFVGNEREKCLYKFPYRHSHCRPKCLVHFSYNVTF